MMQSGTLIAQVRAGRPAEVAGPVASLPAFSRGTGGRAASKLHTAEQAHQDCMQIKLRPNQSPTSSNSSDAETLCKPLISCTQKQHQPASSQAQTQKTNSEQH